MVRTYSVHSHFDFTYVSAAMKILDPHMPNGVHEWRDGRRVVKDGMAFVY